MDVVCRWTLVESSQIATIDRPYKFKNQPTKLSIMRNVHDFFDLFSCCVLPGSSRVDANTPHFHEVSPNSVGDKNSSGSRVRAKPGQPYCYTVRARGAIARAGIRWLARLAHACARASYSTPYLLWRLYGGTLAELAHSSAHILISSPCEQHEL